jgi:hypothetical protein
MLRFRLCHNGIWINWWHSNLNNGNGSAQKRLRQTLTFFDQMSRELALSLLRQGNNGSDILQILETITSDIEQENINDCAAHYASISAPTLTAIQF